MARAALVIVMVVSLAGQAWAGTPTDQLRAYTDRVLQVLEDPALTPPQRLAAVRQVANDAFDLSETARRALGAYWQRRTAAEREEFVGLFRTLLELTYLSRLGEYGGERVRYVGERITGDQAVVRALVVTRKGTEVPVEGRLLEKDGRWRIYDVLVENISLVANYRTQFDRVIRNESYEELVRRLKARIKALSAGETMTGHPARAAGQ